MQSNRFILPEPAKLATFINLVYNIPDDNGGAALDQYNRDVDQAITKLNKYVALTLAFRSFSQ